MTTLTLPATGYLRLKQIIGNPKATPPIIPVSKTTWWDGIKKGVYPKGHKLSPRITAWKVEDIRALVEQLGGAA